MTNIIDSLKAYFTRTPSQGKYFPVTKSNGEIQGQISQADLVAAVKEALPAILADQSTNFASVLTKNSQGVLGVASNANLASVLGATNGTSIPGGGSIEVLNGLYIIGQGYRGFNVVSLGQKGITLVGGPGLEAVNITITASVISSGDLVTKWSIANSASVERFFRKLI